MTNVLYCVVDDNFWSQTALLRACAVTFARCRLLQLCYNIEWVRYQLETCASCVSFSRAAGSDCELPVSVNCHQSDCLSSLTCSIPSLRVSRFAQQNQKELATSLQTTQSRLSLQFLLIHTTLPRPSLTQASYRVTTSDCNVAALWPANYLPHHIAAYLVFQCCHHCLESHSAAWDMTCADQVTTGLNMMSSPFLPQVQNGFFQVDNPHTFCFPGRLRRPGQR